MRILVLFALAALAAVTGLLLADGDGQERGPRPPSAEAPPETPRDPPAVPGLADRLRAAPQAPEAQGLLERLVADAAARGDKAVPELARILRHEPDVLLQARWDYRDGRLRAYPTLRAACIAALVGIPGQASRDVLLEVLDLTPSVDEAYLIAQGLAERGDGGWTEGALEKAGKEAGPPHLRTQEQLVDLAARADPQETAAQIVLRAPRGTDPTDPKVLARGLRALPLDAALATTRQLLADAVVTRKAKERYVRELCDRGDPEAFERLRDVVDRGDLDAELALSIAYSAAGSRAFHEDATAWELERVSGGGAEIAARFGRRLNAAEALVASVLRDLPPEDPRRGSLDRMLDRHRERLR